MRKVEPLEVDPMDGTFDIRSDQDGVEGVLDVVDAQIKPYGLEVVLFSGSNKYSTYWKIERMKKAKAPRRIKRRAKK